MPTIGPTSTAWPSYAEDAQWLDANPNGPHCHNREDIFAMFRQPMASGIRVGFDELRSTPTEC